MEVRTPARRSVSEWDYPELGVVVGVKNNEGMRTRLGSPECSSVW
jgi:hypothetical protein